MPRLDVLVVIDCIAIGCHACGWWISGRPAEVELLVETTRPHVGPVVAAQRASVDGAPFRWLGDAALVAEVVAAA